MITSGFFNSNNGDRKYDALQFSSIFDGIIRDGVFGTCGSAFAVTKNPNVPMVVDVAPGRAWFNHTWTLNDAIHSLTLGSSDPTRNRIDAVVLEVNNDEAVRTNTIKIVEGEISDDAAVRPTMIRSDHVNQYAIAYITVRALSTDIKASDIVNVVGTEETPLITGLLQMIDITNLLADYTKDIKDLESGYTAEFRAWFANLQNELDSNQAAHLQHQIDVNKADSVNKGDIKNTYQAIKDATDANSVAGALGVKDMDSTMTMNINNITTQLNNLVNTNLKASDGLVFNFTVNGAGKYGYLKADGSFVPFNKLPYQIEVSYRVRGHLHWSGDWGSKHYESNTNWANAKAVYTRQTDDTYKLTSGGSAGSPADGIGAGNLTDARYWSGQAEITGINFVYD